MVTVHAGYVAKQQPMYGVERPGLWASVCGSQNGPISDDPLRINCEGCKRIMSQRGTLL